MRGWIIRYFPPRDLLRRQVALGVLHRELAVVEGHGSVGAGVTRLVGVEDQPLDRLDHALAEEDGVVDGGRDQGLAVLLEVVDLGLARLAEGVELLVGALAAAAARAEAEAGPAGEGGGGGLARGVTIRRAERAGGGRCE